MQPLTCTAVLPAVPAFLIVLGLSITLLGAMLIPAVRSRLFGPHNKTLKQIRKQRTDFIKAAKTRKLVKK